MRFPFLTHLRSLLSLACALPLISTTLPLPARADETKAANTHHSQGLDPEVRQLLVSIAPDWESGTGSMVGFERAADGRWKATLGPIPVIFGKRGLAWGRGVLGTDEPGLQKIEHDWRAPAGVFKIGRIYTNDKNLPPGAHYPFHTITAGDAWVDDSTLPQYNRFVSIDPANPPPWFAKQKMRTTDPTYRWLIEIRHNSNPPIPRKGSAIFFHTRRVRDGVTRPSSGCTTMAQADLISMIRWLNADKHPHYALLPWNEYQKKWQVWSLPKPEALNNIKPK